LVASAGAWFSENCLGNRQVLSEKQTLERLDFETAQQMYFVAETKGKGQEHLPGQRQKIKWGKELFSAFSEVIHRQGSSVTDLSI
jgi:hypothetical protein